MEVDEKDLRKMIELIRYPNEDFIDLLKGMFGVLSENDIEKIKDCIFIDFIPEWKARFINKSLLPSSVKNIIIIQQGLFFEEAQWGLPDNLVKTIFHEFAHCALDHKDSQLDKPHNEQEEEADKLADKWFSEWKKKAL